MAILHRLKYYSRQFVNNIRWQFNKHFNPGANRRKLEHCETMANAISSAEKAEIDKIVSEQYYSYRNNEPTLNPRRTMLIHSRPEEHRCNFITAPYYEREIHKTLEWAKAHGITTFLTDYSTPFGLLALEILLKSRETDDTFSVYAIKSLPISKRRSYRLIPETPIEVIFLVMQADYVYHIPPDEVHYRIFPNIATYRSEVSYWISETRLPDYILEAWQS